MIELWKTPILAFGICLACVLTSSMVLAQEEDATFRAMKTHVLDYLTEHDIPEELAEGIIKYQGGDFYLWFQFDKAELNRRLNFILRITDEPQLLNELEQFPELTNLFAGIMAYPDPDAVENLLASVRNLSTSEQCDIYGLYAVNPTPEEVCKLARLLRVPKYRKWILKLWRHSPANLDLIPYLHLAQAEWQESPRSAKAFEEWIFQTINMHLNTNENDPRAMEAWYILMCLSEPVRDNMRDDGFRERFQNEIWPAVLRMLDSVADQPDVFIVKEIKTDKLREIYCDSKEFQKIISIEPEGFVQRNDDGTTSKILADSRMITYEDRLMFALGTLCDSMDFFRVFPKEGVPLFEKVGVNAVAILLDETFYNPQDPNNSIQKQARNHLAYLLLYGREANADGINVPYAILTIPTATYGELRKFLNKKGISNEAVQVGIAMLGGCKTEQEVFDKLIYWNSLPMKTLMKEDPFNTTTYNPVGWIPGYDICAFIGKTLDGRRVTGGDMLWATVDAIMLPIEIASAITTGTSGNVGLSCLKNGAKVGTKYLSRRASQELILAMAKTGGIFTPKTLSFCSQGTLAEILRVSRGLQAINTLESNIDVTSFVRCLFRYSKLGCETFKKYTGLDARIFMRGDRKVEAIIHCDKMGENFSYDIGFNAAFDLAINSDVGQATLASAIEKYKKFTEFWSDTDRWKANLSSWWGVCQKMDGKR